MAKNEKPVTERDPNEPYTTVPTTQTDLALFLDREAGGETPTVGEARDFAVEGNDTSGYVGVAPEYQTYGDPNQAPLLAEEGPESVMEQQFIESLAVPKEGVVTDTDEEGDTVEADRSEPDTAPVTPTASASEASASKE